MSEREIMLIRMGLYAGFFAGKGWIDLQIDGNNRTVTDFIAESVDMYQRVDSCHSLPFQLFCDEVLTKTFCAKNEQRKDIVQTEGHVDDSSSDQMKDEYALIIAPKLEGHEGFTICTGTLPECLRQAIINNRYNQWRMKIEKIRN